MKLSTQKQGTLDTSIGTMRTCEKDFWKHATIAMKIAISHVIAGGNIATVQKVVNAATSNRRRDLFKFASAFLAYDTDSKAMRFKSKSKNAKLVTRKTEAYAEWVRGTQSIQTWINTKSEKVAKVLTPAEVKAKSNKAVERMLNSGYEPADMVAAILDHEGVTVQTLLGILHNVAHPVAEAA